MIEMLPIVPRINKLRVINIYEVDDNLQLKFFWLNKAIKNAVNNKLIGENQWECIPGGSTDLVALIDEFITETHTSSRTMQTYASIASSIATLLYSAVALKYPMQYVNSTPPHSSISNTAYKLPSAQLNTITNIQHMTPSTALDKA